MVAGIPVALSNCVRCIIRNVGISETVGSRFGCHMLMAVGEGAISSCDLSRGLVRDGRIRDNLGGGLSLGRGGSAFGVGWRIVGLCQRLDGGICCDAKLATSPRRPLLYAHGTYKLYEAALQGR